MDPSEFHAPGAGKVVSSPEGYAAFVPAPLPPRITYTKDLVLALSRADAALGELSGVGGELPDPQLLDASFKRQEALCSSRIEGAQVSLSDLYLDQVGAARQSVPRDHLREVRACISTLRFGVELLREEPLSLEFIKALHERLLRGEVGGVAHAGRVPHLAELARPARRHHGDGDLRAGAGRRAAGGAGRVRGVPAGTRHAARPHPVRDAPRAVREHPPVRRRQRPAGAAAHHAVPHRARPPHAAAAVSLGVPRGSPRRVLRAAPARAHAQRVDAVAHVLRRRRPRDGRARDPPGARAHPPLRARPREGQGPRAAPGRRALPHAGHDRAGGQAHPRGHRPDGAPRGARARGARPARGVVREALAARLPGAARPRRRAAPARGPAQRAGRGGAGHGGQVRGHAGAEQARAPRRPPHDRGHGHHRRGPRQGRAAAPHRRPRRAPLLHRPRLHGPRVLGHRLRRARRPEEGDPRRSSRASTTPRTATSRSPPTRGSCSTSRPRRSRA